MQSKIETKCSILHVSFKSEYHFVCNIASGDGLVPLGNKPLPEPMIEQSFLEFIADYISRTKKFLIKVEIRK